MKTALPITAAVLVSLGGVTAFAAHATFNAETRNPFNGFASGTLVLSDTKQGGTTCLSTAGGSTDTNTNASCDSLASLTAAKPGDSASTNLTLKNEGSIAASAFKVFSSATCSDSNNASETYHGTGSMCSSVLLTIQQYSDASFTTPSGCVYGHATGSSCDFTDATKTLASFSSTYTSASGLTIGSGLAAGASGYFKVSVQLPSTAGNSVQGRAAAADLTWHIDQ